MRTKLSRNALIGLAFIASLIMIYFGINFLKGVNVLKKQNQYYALFDDVSKLLISSPIYVKGYQIGLINRIEMASDDPMRFAVGLNLSENVNIPRDSYLEYDIDMFGASTVNLVMGSSVDYIQLGDTITGGRLFGLMDEVASVMPKADSLLLRVDSLIYSLHKIMTNPAWEQSIQSIGSTADQLSRSSASLNRMMASLEKDIPEVSKNLASVSSDLKEVSSEVSQIDLAGMFTSIDETVDNLKLLTAKINSDDNSVGLLLNDTKLHDSLSITLNTAAKLLEDVRQNPDRYLKVRVKLF